MSARDPIAQDTMGAAEGLPWIDPRESDVDRSAVTDADLSTGPRRWWSFLTSDRAAVWTARILSLLLWQLAGMQIERIPTPIEVGEFLVDHSDLLLPNIWVTVQTALVALVVVRVVQKLMLRAVILVVLLALGVFAFVARDELRQ